MKAARRGDTVYIAMSLPEAHVLIAALKHYLNRNQEPPAPNWDAAFAWAMGILAAL